MGDVESTGLPVLESTVKYHSCKARILTCDSEACAGTVLGGQFFWGGSLLKSNGGALWHPQRGWQSRAERKGKWVLNCETDQVEQM